LSGDGAGLLRSGVDLIELDRIQGVIRRHGERYLERVYTAAELAQGNRQPEYLAGRFAAKEAVAKALGTGIGDVGWKDIEVLGDEQHAPVLRLYGAAKDRADALGLSDWSVSISHSMSHVVAFAVALRLESSS
jgi:holo-[acyl-carrier protein] synthase